MNGVAGFVGFVAFTPVRRASFRPSPGAPEGARPRARPARRSARSHAPAGPRTSGVHGRRRRRVRRRRVTRWCAAGRQPAPRETAAVARRCGPSPHPERPSRPRTRRGRDEREGVRTRAFGDGSRRAGTSGLVRDGRADEDPSATGETGPRVVEPRPGAGAAARTRECPAQGSAPHTLVVRGTSVGAPGPGPAAPSCVPG